MEHDRRPSLSGDAAILTLESRKSSTSKPPEPPSDQSVIEPTSLPSNPPQIREGLVKGYGGAIEKTIAGEV
jgi:hypothetical protein